MLALNRRGTSPIHRASAGWKLIALIALISAISITGANLVVSLVSFAAIFALFAVAFGDAKTFAKQLWSLKWLIAISLIPQLFFTTAAIAATITLRLTDIILLAALFTLTTKTADLIQAIERGLQPIARPLTRIGLHPQTISLIFAMTINAIPMILLFTKNVQEAQKARGQSPRIHLMAVPVLVASLKYADEFADSLTARGVSI